ncbi:hypothetical protein CDAR_476821 [Caerostris darwini]|uniref:Uncharacterized protein n=1 Tax=Caerostris darwini TaxID=1538125 RepID=A0AAV4U500_9ARAC|nr:hypothetical protein CDAR_476821 [Caerostris darwini]
MASINTNICEEPGDKAVTWRGLFYSLVRDILGHSISLITFGIPTTRSFSISFYCRTIRRLVSRWPSTTGTADLRRLRIALSPSTSDFLI